MPDLADDLRALGADIAWPPTPDLSAGSDPFPPPRARDLSRRRSRGLTPRWRRWQIVVALLVLLALPAAAAAVPPVRHAVLDALGLRHVAVERRATVPRALRDPHMGDRTTLAGAARAAGFVPRLPAALGAPARVFERDGIVTVTYPGGLLLAQARGALPQREVLRKVVTFDDAVVRTTVAGAPALFLGAGHVYAWTDATGPPVRSGPALVWEAGGRVLRLEGEASLPAARAVAASVR